MDKWFISDTHFFHSNIIKYCNRPFENADVMDETMIQNWNNTVKPNDKVYHLGDVALGFGGDDKKLGNLLRRLNGKKRLIAGNHDNLKSVSLQTFFEKIEIWYGNKDWGFTCSHIPLPLTHLRDGKVNVHGHIHNNVEDNPRYISVCVERRNYTPVHLDTILTEIKNIA